MSADARISVIGLGNPDRGDDGLGRRVAAALARHGIPGVAVQELPGEATELIEALEGCERAIIVDAASFGGLPGQIFRFDAAATPVPRDLGGTSTHGFGLAQGIELARALGRLPRSCVVYAVQFGTLEAGAGLSPPVAAAAEEVERRILMECAPGGTA